MVEAVDSSVRLFSLRQLNIRNLVTERFAFEPGVTALVGPNAAGKSNLVEAVTLGLSGVGAGGRVAQSLRFGEQEGYVRAEFESADGRHVVEVSLAPGRRQVRLDGQTVRALELATLGGVVRIEPDDVDLVLGPPARRRAFLDHLLARLSLRYALVSREYQRVLEQRNALLREGGSGPVQSAWDERFVTLGREVDALRARAMPRLAEHAAAAYERIAGPGHDFVVQLERVAAEADLGDALAATRAAERARGATLVGPQRDDLRLDLRQRPLAAFGSRGEARTAALALRVAEHALLEARHGTPPLLIIDDVHAELDEHRRAFLVTLAGTAPQALVTGTEVPPGATRVWRIAAGRVDVPTAPVVATTHNG